jgi:hypothetical protein
MKRRRHTPEQIVRKLREADRLLAEGREFPRSPRRWKVSEATYHRWHVWVPESRSPRPSCGFAEGGADLDDRWMALRLL